MKNRFWPTSVHFAATAPCDDLEPAVQKLDCSRHTRTPRRTTRTGQVRLLRHLSFSILEVDWITFRSRPIAKGKQSGCNERRSRHDRPRKVSVYRENMTELCLHEENKGFDAKRHLVDRWPDPWFRAKPEQWALGELIGAVVHGSIVIEIRGRSLVRRERKRTRKKWLVKLELAVQPVCTAMNERIERHTGWCISFAITCKVRRLGKHFLLVCRGEWKIMAVLKTME